MAWLGDECMEFLLFLREIFQSCLDSRLPSQRGFKLEFIGGMKSGTLVLQLCPERRPGASPSDSPIDATGVAKVLDEPRSA